MDQALEESAGSLVQTFFVTRCETEALLYVTVVAYNSVVGGPTGLARPYGLVVQGWLTRHEA